MQETAEWSLVRKHNIPSGILYIPHKKRKKVFFSKGKQRTFFEKISHKILDLGTFLKKKFPNSEALKFLEKKIFPQKQRKILFLESILNFKLKNFN